MVTFCLNHLWTTKTTVVAAAMETLMAVKDGNVAANNINKSMSLIVRRKDSYMDTSDTLSASAACELPLVLDAQLQKHQLFIRAAAFSLAASVAPFQRYRPQASQKTFFCRRPRSMLANTCTARALMSLSECGACALQALFTAYLMNAPPSEDVVYQ